MNWRRITDFVKRRDWPLHLADRLGRGRGRLRVLDQLHLAPPPPRIPELRNWHRQTLAAAWIGHATVLIRIGGQTVLTDPVLSNRIGIGLGVLTGGPRRLARPALSLHQLPRIDVILLSHAHFDHLDRPTLARLSKQSVVVTARGLTDLVKDLGFRRVMDLDWGQTTQVGRLRFTARPVQHWGARTFLDKHRGYCAFQIGDGEHQVFFGADTAYHNEWVGLGPVDLAILGIGAYDPYIAAHATPEQALQMADHLQARFILPMHHSTFKLSNEPIHEPINRLLNAPGRDPSRIIIRGIGDEWSLGPAQEPA